MQYTIQIPKPCHEPWEKMTQEGNGRHCAQCSKTVVDFTGWAREDIQHYVAQQGTTKVCGRFRQEQLGSFDTILFIHSVAYAPLPLLKKIAAIFLLAFGLIQMSCNTDSKPDQRNNQVTGAIVVPPPPTEKQNDTTRLTTLGMVTPVSVYEKAKHKHKTKATNTANEAQHLTGEVEYIPIDTTKK